MSKTANPFPDWPGFDTPHYTPVPDDLFDLWLPYLSGAELKVLLYLMRRTFGFKKDSDSVSLSQITDGIVREDGRRLDHGAGVARSSAVIAIAALEAKGLIFAERSPTAAQDHVATIYRLRLREGEGRSENRTSSPGPWSDNRTSFTPIRSENRTRSGPKRALKLDRKSDLQETVQETVQETDDSNHITPPEKREGAAPLPQPRYTLPESHYITRVISDFSRDFDDDPHRASNTAQALRLWGNSGLDEQTFVAQLQTARRLTRRYQGRQGLGTIENKMAYFFTTLRQVLQNHAAS